MKLTGIPGMKDFPNISKISDFLSANLGNLDKSMISERYPQARAFINRNFSHEKLFPEKLKVLAETFLGEKFLGGNDSGWENVSL